MIDELAWMVSPLALGAGLAAAGLAGPSTCNWPSRTSSTLGQRIRHLAAELPSPARRMCGLGVMALVLSGCGAAAYAAQPTTPRQETPLVARPVPAAIAPPAVEPAAQAAPTSRARPAPIRASAPAAAPTAALSPPSSPVWVTYPDRPVPTGFFSADAPYVSFSACLAVAPGQVAAIATSDGEGRRDGDCYDRVTGAPIERTLVNYGLPRTPSAVEAAAEAVARYQAQLGQTSPQGAGTAATNARN